MGCYEIHAQTMNSDDFGDPLTLTVVPQSCQRCLFSSKHLLYELGQNNCTGIQGSQRTYHNDSGDPLRLTFVALKEMSQQLDGLQ